VGGRAALVSVTGGQSPLSAAAATAATKASAPRRREKGLGRLSQRTACEAERLRLRLLSPPRLCAAQQLNEQGRLPRTQQRWAQQPHAVAQRHGGCVAVKLQSSRAGAKECAKRENVAFRRQPPTRKDVVEHYCSFQASQQDQHVCVR